MVEIADAPEGAPEAPAPEGAPAAPAAPAAPTVPEGEEDRVPVSLLREQREENRKYRERWQPVERAFAGIEDEGQRQALLSFVQMWATDPDQAFAQLAQVRGYDVAEAAAEAMEGTAPPGVVTRDEWEAWQAQQAEAAEDAELEAGAQELAQEAQGLGVDPASRAYGSLLGAYELAIDEAEARYESGEDAEFKAPTLTEVFNELMGGLEGFAQEVRDGMVAGKRPGPSPATNAGGAPSDATPLTDFKQSEAAARAFLESQV